jgi:hypothetical protein
MITARHDADDAVGGAIDDDVPADSRWIGVVALSPQPVTQHHDASSIGSIVAGSQGTADFRWNPQQVEVTVPARNASSATPRSPMLTITVVRRTIAVLS